MLHLLDDNRRAKSPLLLCLQNGAAPQRWAEEFSTGRPDWEQEFSQQQASQAGSKAAQQNGTALEQTRALRDTMAGSADPKFRNSKFLQFLSKMSRGEIILEDNQARMKLSSERDIVLTVFKR